MGAQVEELGAEATSLLQDLLRVDTSNPPGNETPAAELLAGYLSASGVDCELLAREPARANLIARLPGGGREAASLMLLGHTDVVPADPAGWTHPPFAGNLDDDGWVWGRGALDMKNELVTRAVAMAAIARSGQTLDGDLVLVACADEEDGTNRVGMSWLVDERPELATDYVINEGATDRLELSDGRRVALIAVGEKAAAGVRVTALGTPGHASEPEGVAHALPALAELIRRLVAYRPRRHLIPATEALVERLFGSESIDDLDDVPERARALHPELGRMIAPLLSTTIAPTQLHGSTALNVLPGRASVDCDCRLLPGTGVDALWAELHEALGTDLPYELELLEPPVGGTISPVDSPLYEACARIIGRHDPGTLLIPVLCAGFTDSHYPRAAFGSTAYGLWPSRATPLEMWRGTVHGDDERVHVDDLGYATQFHLELCQALLRSGSAASLRPPA